LAQVGRLAYRKSDLHRACQFAFLSGSVSGFFCGCLSGLPDRRMIGLRRMRIFRAGGAKVAAALLVLATLAACTGSEHFGSAQPEPPSTAPSPSPPPPPPTPPPPTPPPIDLAGRWKLAAAAGGACFMAFGDAPGAVQGTIAPEGGCPGSFFTARKWTFEHDTLIIRDHKDEPLARLSYSGDRFEGEGKDGGALSLSR